MTGRSSLLIVALVATVALATTGCGGTDEDMADIPGLGATRIDVPRPTGSGSAACDEDPLPPSTDETIVERVAALRAIGLFADRSDESDATLASEIESDLLAVWGDPAASDEATMPIPLDDPLMDLFVANQDATRVWWRDLEADVLDGNDVYVDTLIELADISVGAFEPTEISESWAGDRGPVTIEFVEDGAPRTLEPAYIDDWIDPGILVGLNERIAGSGRRFELVKAFDQTAFVMALTTAEREAFEARGWCFE